MKKGIIILLLFPMLIFSQKKKEIIQEIRVSIEARTLLLKAFGNNHLSKDLRPFFGYGFGATFIANKYYGLGLDYNWLYSNIIYGRENLSGNIGAPTMVNVDFSFIHKDEITEDFMLEEVAGLSTYRMKSQYNTDLQTFTEGNNGFHIGIKGVYNLDREGFQQVVVGIKGNYYLGKIYNENTTIRDYYGKSYFLNLSLAYRYFF